jgi:hypothetical protein
LRVVTSDSEGENERLKLERQHATDEDTVTHRTWRGHHLIAGDNNREPRVMVGDASQILSNENGTADRYAAAAVVPRHAWNRAVVRLLLAINDGCAAMMAPRSAQQRGVLTDCQKQRDRKNGCSKHGTLGIFKSKSRARDGRGPMRKSAVLGRRAFATGRTCEFCGV